MSKKRKAINRSFLPGVEPLIEFNPTTNITPQKEEVKEKHTAISIHAIKQFFADPTQLSLFSDEKVNAFEKTIGIHLPNRPSSYGVVLNQSQRRVFEGIVKAFSDTNYLGEEQINKDTYSSTVHPINRIEGAYNNIDSIPVIKLTQSDIIRLSGYQKSQGDKVDVVEAISFLATKQFCFYWVRLKTDSKGKPVKSKSGDFEKEEVMEVGTLLRIKTIREGGELKYYEIHPTSVILDQVNSRYGGNYFLLVPDNWKEEVKQLTGTRASSYTYELLLWLRLKYEEIRRGNSRSKNKKPFILHKSWEEIAEALKMPESMYKANRKRASKIIQEAYSTAIKLGYLLRVENRGAIDILYLNEEYYPKPGKLV